MRMTNCPNCGAVITGPQCEYCNTRFDIKVVSYEPVARLKSENELINHKIRLLADTQALENLYAEALKAMRNYGGNHED